MSIVNEAVKRIRQSIDLPSQEGWRDEEDPRPICLPAHIQGAIREKSPHPEEVLASSKDVLGSYKRMSSQGILKLHVDVLDSFFWHTLLKLYRAPHCITDTDLNYLCRLTVLKTYYHEQFHHLCDVSRYLFGCVYSKDEEEALAVAYSYRQLLAMMKDKMNQPLYAEFMELIYGYTGQGYRDWTRFVHPDDLSEGLVSYIGPMSSQKLYSCGISAETILLAIKSAVDTQGVQEQLVDRDKPVWPAQRAWFVRPDLEPGESVQDLTRGLIISIGDKEVGDLTGQNRAGIVERVRTFKRVVSNRRLPSVLNPLNAIANEMKHDDTVYVWLGKQADEALVGTIKGDYEYFRHRGCAPHVRRVIWDSRNRTVNSRKLFRNGIQTPNSGSAIVPAEVGIEDQPTLRQDVDLY